MTSSDPRRPVLLESAAEAARHLTAVRPRDCVFVVYEVTDPAHAGPVLAGMPVSQRLLVAVCAGPVLRSVVSAGWAGDRVAAALADYLGDQFPPVTAVPLLPPGWLEPFRELALGAPGEPVTHGLFPSTPTKLARLALARSGAYPAAAVRLAAEHAYDLRTARYHAHDALACALAHPDVDVSDLIGHAGLARTRRGWRSRHKTHRLVAWGRHSGFLPAD